MARTKEELRELVAVLKELKATSNLGIDADLDRMNKAISKIGKGETGGFQDLIVAAQDMKRVLKEALEVSPEGIYKVNQALAQTVALAKQIPKAGEAYSGLAGQEKNQLRYLQTAPVPAPIQRQLDEYANIQKTRDLYYKPTTGGTNEYINTRLPVIAQKEMNAEFEKRAQPFLEAIDQEAAAAKEAATEAKAATDRDKAVKKQVETALKELEKSIKDEAKERENSTAQAKRILDESKVLGARQDKADFNRLKKLGEQTYAAGGIDLNREATAEEKRAAAATAEGEAREKSLNIAKQEAKADAETQQVLREYIARKQEQIKLEQDLLKVKQQVLKAEGEAVMDAYEAQGKMFPKGGTVTPQLNPLGAVGDAFGGNIQKIEQFQQRLQRLGFEGLNNITRVSKDAASGVTTITAAMTDFNGVAQEATVHIDRFGNVTQSSSNNFKSFGDILTNNIKKVLEWTFAIGVVYGSINKIQEVFANMSQLQDLLNDIQITTGQTGAVLQDTFSSVVQVANTVGVSAVDSLKAMNYALKITGDSSSGIERTARATQLLEAALTLSKLGAIPITEAMDTLVAALEQSDTSLANVNNLLSSFQAIAKSTGGSIHDMATTFGITAGAAADVGVGIHELDGIIGAFAAVTTKSAEETGNALKIMFSNYQNDKAVATLQKFGIAVKDFTTGEARSFIDVMDEVNERVNAGLLSRAAQSEIANAIGGGGRRAADVTALMGAWSRVSTYVDTSTAAYERGTDASDALKIKQETLVTAVNQLNNSFLTLSNTLGGSGGFVPVMTDLVKLATNVIEGINGITTALGPLNVAFAALAALAVGNKIFGNQFREFAGNASAMLLGRTGTPGRGSLEAAVSAGGGIIPAAEAGGKAFATTATSGIKSFFTGGFASAFAPVLGLSLMEAAQGNYAAALGSGIAGAFMAGVSKSGLWASIGAALATIIVTQIQYIIDTKNKAEAAEKLGIQGYEAYKKENPNATAEQWQREMSQRLQDMVGNQTFGSGLNKLATGLDQSQMAQVAAKQLETLNTKAPGLLEKYFESQNFQATSPEDWKARVQAVGVLEDRIDEVLRSSGAGLTQAPGYSGVKDVNSELVITKDNLHLVSEVSMGLSLVTKDLTKVMEEAAAAEKKQTESQLAGQVAFKSAFEGRGLESYNKLRNDLLLQMGQPGSEVSTGPQYRAKLEQGAAAQVLTPQILSALHPGVTTAGAAGKFADEFDKLFEVLSRAPKERVDFIAQISTEISRLTDSISTGKSTNLKLDQEELSVNQQILAIQLQLAEVEAAKSQIVYPGFEDMKDMTKKEVLKAAADAERVQSYVVGEMGLDPNLFKKSLDDIYVLTKDGLIKIKGLSKDFFSPAIEGIKDMKKQLEDSFNFQNLRDYPIDVAGRLQKAMNYYQNLLKQWGLNEKIEKFTFLFKDNQVAQLIGSQTALQLALQDLTQVEKKQLDGIYNLPSGATAFIPLQAGQMLSNYTQNQVGAAPYDYGNFPTPALTPLQNPLEGINMNTAETNRILLSGFKAGQVPYRNAEDFDTKQPWYIKYRAQNIPPYADINSPEFKKQTWGESFWDKYGIKQAPTAKPTAQADPLVQSITAPIQALVNSIRNFFGIPKTGAFGSLDNKTGLTPQTVNISVKPEKVTNEFSTNIVLRVDGRSLATVMKKYLFEDYQRLTASVGKTSRSTPGVI